MRRIEGYPMERTTAKALTEAEVAAIKAAPTCFLQWELERREGIRSKAIGLDEAVDVIINGKRWGNFRGPLTVSINYD